ncbi:nitrogen regulatory protein P-II family [Anaeromicropila populeti]|uniref:Nitrogen regulatory protein P-II family n=2 Tax=Anaeromicropila populeti TaxID=37658 RepID=A0A1I6KSE8_9FIRM|nr:nitrogen regulatory protein P-II family [Anaeromicropila populeti]
MRLLFYILNKTEKLDLLLAEFSKRGIQGATVIEGKGMARILFEKHGEDEMPFLSSLRKFLNPERENSNIIFAVIRNEQLSMAVETIEEIVGDLSKSNNGVVFSFPVDFTKGMIDDGK